MAFRLLPFQPVLGHMHCPVRGILGAASVEYQQVRGFLNNKHRERKFRNLRRMKIDSKVPLKYMDNYQRGVRDGYFQNIRNIKKLWREREVFTPCSNVLIDEFVPPENQGRAITEEIKKKWNDVGQFGKDKLAVRKIRTYESEFNLKVFQPEALEIYIKAHECLAANDLDKLSDYATEHARLAMLLNSSKRTIHWKFLQALEPPKVVQVRLFQLESQSDVFAQLTVRLLTQQVLAVYDRFGRLIYGSEILAKDVLEYAVFEKQLSNEYGTWKLHGKIIPSDRIRMAEQTFVAPREPPQESSSVMTESDANIKEEKVVATS
ncbi:putative 39S ribosomal protein L45, mitochondrial [Frankliniella fusca]|uniref:Large ribosomal subunit protein mL45 n=1 Tax=Frankliniella fusca TaxID=407009 RepID=A0AAE1HDV3_9NEOP|nr:putative 39S ribosomal protein L45, mitochondrial [Frankliniella fusca]